MTGNFSKNSKIETETATEGARQMLGNNFESFNSSLTI